MASNELALSAWYESGADAARVYVPVLVGGTSTSDLEVILYPGVDMNDCAVSLQMEEGTTNLMEKRQPVRRKYPAADPIRVLLPPNLKPGVYKFEAFAHMSSGGVANASARLQLP